MPTLVVSTKDYAKLLSRSLTDRRDRFLDSIQCPEYKPAKNHWHNSCHFLVQIELLKEYLFDPFNLLKALKYMTVPENQTFPKS